MLVVLVAAVCAQAAVLARAVSRAIVPVPSVSAGPATALPARAFRAAQVAALFGEALRPPASAAVAPPPALTVKATIAVDDGRGLAILAADGSSATYAVGQLVPGGLVLLRVYPDRVEIGPAGAERGTEIRLPTANLSGLGVRLADSASDGTEAEPADDAASRYASQLEQFQKDASFDSNIVVARPLGQGMRYVELRPSGGDALMRTVGLEPGDWVTHVAGRPISDPAAIAALRSAFVGKGGSVKVTVQRRDAGLVTVDVNLPAR